MPTCEKCKHKHYAYEPHVPVIADPGIWSDPTVNIDSKYANR